MPPPLVQRKASAAEVGVDAGADDNRAVGADAAGPLLPGQPGSVPSPTMPPPLVQRNASRRRRRCHGRRQPSHRR